MPCRRRWRRLFRFAWRGRRGPGLGAGGRLRRLAQGNRPFARPSRARARRGSRVGAAWLTASRPKKFSRLDGDPQPTEHQARHSPAPLRSRCAAAASELPRGDYSASPGSDDAPTRNTLLGLAHGALTASRRRTRRRAVSHAREAAGDRGRLLDRERTGGARLQGQRQGAPLAADLRPGGRFRERGGHASGSASSASATRSRSSAGTTRRRPSTRPSSGSAIASPSTSRMAPT